MAFLSPSPIEIVVILVIALLVLGPSRLPETARSIGRGMRELRDTLQGIGGDDEDEDEDREPDRRRDDPGGLPVMLPEGEGNDLDEHGDLDDASALDEDEELNEDDSELDEHREPHDGYAADEPSENDLSRHR